MEKAVARGRELGKLTMYFGALDRTGHYLHIGPHQSIATPWSFSLMGSGLLKNGNHRDVCDGKVFWTCGGFDAFWYAFFWWDRSVDGRPGSNSGFYVCGFGWPEVPEAFDYACQRWPTVIARQEQLLVLQEPK